MIRERETISPGERIMTMETKRKLEKRVLLAVKIAVGSALAIYIAEAMHLEFAVSAGTVTLLSLLGTKRETVRVSAIRIVTFFLTSLLAVLLIPWMHSEWVAFGIVIFIVALLSVIMGWKASLSVNGVIAAHYMMKMDFSIGFIYNEFMLVLIGVIIALVLNLFQMNKNRRKDIIEDMRYVERTLQGILREMAAYLRGEQLKPLGVSVWEEICTLEKKLREFMEEAMEYQNNNFAAHHDYYLYYFEMRLGQCHMLDSLHAEMKKIRTVPKQAKVVADYMDYLAEYVLEKNVPDAQMERLQGIFEDMKKEEMPESQEEFESRALLYHIMMDIEEFLNYKISFIEDLSERQRKEYWD